MNARTITITEADEKLGPVDLGPPGRWRHLRYTMTGEAVCGGRPPVGKEHDPRSPDCVRWGEAHGMANVWIP